MKRQLDKREQAVKAIRDICIKDIYEKIQKGEITKNHFYTSWLPMLRHKDQQKARSEGFGYGYEAAKEGN